MQDSESRLSPLVLVSLTLNETRENFPQPQRTQLEKSERLSFSVSCQNYDASVLPDACEVELLSRSSWACGPGRGAQGDGGVEPRKSLPGSFTESSERLWPWIRCEQAQGLISLFPSWVNMSLTMLMLTLVSPQFCRPCAGIFVQINQQTFRESLLHPCV